MATYLLYAPSIGERWRRTMAVITGTDGRVIAPSWLAKDNGMVTVREDGGINIDQDFMYFRNGVDEGELVHVTHGHKLKCKNKDGHNVYCYEE